jgi:hypothetical protein
MENLAGSGRGQALDTDQVPIDLQQHGPLQEGHRQNETQGLLETDNDPFDAGQDTLADSDSLACLNEGKRLGRNARLNRRLE